MVVSILAVDDETDVAELFRQRFRSEARQGTYVLHFANSGDQALQLLDDEIEPELLTILSDINMPGMDGLTLLERVKQRFLDLPVMMVMAYGTTSDAAGRVNWERQSSSPNRWTSSSSRVNWPNLRDPQAEGSPVRARRQE